jgi:tetratricopeptide (TPR) repeat protein
MGGPHENDPMAREPNLEPTEVIRKPNLGSTEPVPGPNLGSTEPVRGPNLEPTEPIRNANEQTESGRGPNLEATETAGDPHAVPPSTPHRRRGASDRNRADYARLLEVDPDHYVVGAQIARGGMGQIHVARDRRLGRDVALKELAVDGLHIARRFEREARITASLQHPSIVGVFEAGRWPTGEPFYAMELVAGRPLQALIAQTTSLDQRLAFLPALLAVADAIAYAHSQRVIHRDLKPSNVIVGEFGETIVIDWGLAKRIGEAETPMSQRIAASEDQTVVGEVMGTPGYMSPEQAAGEPVDERTDVYAIGVMMTSALLGKRPKELLPIAQLEPRIPADLAAIVDRAKATDRAARYANARELADDLRRFQTGQLVGAHRYSLRQLLARKLRRHKAVAAVAAVALAVVIVGGVLSIRRIVHEQARAEEQRALAIRGRADAEEIMGFVLFELADRLRTVGRLDLVDKVARRVVAYYDARADTSDLDPARHVVALIGIGGVLRDEGDLRGALTEYERALAIAERRAASEPRVAVWKHHVVEAANRVGETLYAQGDVAGARARHEGALALATQLAAGEPGELRWQRDLAESHRQLAEVLGDQGESKAALAHYESAFEIRKRVVEVRSDDPRARRDLMTSLSDLGQSLFRAHSYQPAITQLRAALALAERAATEDPRDVIAQRDVAIAHERIGSVLAYRGDTDGALEEFGAELAVISKLAALDPSNSDWQRRLSVSHERIGTTLGGRKQYDEALASLETSKQIRVALTERDPTNTRWQRDLSVVINRIGDVRLAQGRTKDAFAAFTAALAIREKLGAKDPTSTKWQGDLFNSHYRLGNAHHQAGSEQEAVTEYKLAARLAKQVLAIDANGVDEGWLLDNYAKLGDALTALHDTVGARAAYEEALVVARRRVLREPDSATFKAAVDELEAKIR